MFLMSLANDLARRESMTAFLCLVVAHLEWPDMMAILRGHNGGMSPDPSARPRVASVCAHCAPSPSPTPYALADAIHQHREGVCSAGAYGLAAHAAAAEGSG